MANFLESMLSGGKVRRQDDKHLKIVQRPLPIRPRQVLELFAAMGVTATFQGLVRAVEFKDADPHLVFFIALGRWPSLAEIAALPDPYRPGPHMIGLLRSREFRAHLTRRTLEIFPERRRLLFVQIPRSGSENVLGLLDGRHPLLPLDLTARRFDDSAVLAQTLGHIFARLSVSNSLAIAHGRMGPFVDPPEATVTGDDPFTWHTVMPPCRPEDLLFSVMREPVERALGQINALLTAWHSGERDLPASLRTRLNLPSRLKGPAEWRQVGRAILAETVLANPICHALGDGTAEGALAACSRSPVQLVQLAQLNLWSRSALENMAADSVPAGEPILRRQDLAAADMGAIEAATAQDRIFYDRFAARTRESGLYVVRGRDI